MARWDPANRLLRFDQALAVARALIRRGEPERSWEIVEERLSAWWPVDNAQVAPVVLLVDQWMSPLMTAERCEQVLSTPRGPEAEG